MPIIVSETCMHNVVAAIRDHCTVFADLQTAGDRQLNRIGAKLYALNFLAVKTATGKAQSMPTAYRFAPPTGQAQYATAVQYMAVCHLARQCADADVAETDAYIALDKVRLRLAIELADDHPALTLANFVAE